MIDNLLSQIAEVIGNNMWLAPLLALIAGVLTSFTPCSLSNIPLVVGYVGGIGEKDTKKAFAYRPLPHTPSPVKPPDFPRINIPSFITPFRMVTFSIKALSVYSGSGSPAFSISLNIRSTPSPNSFT